jgi:hypothetical protein
MDVERMQAASLEADHEMEGQSTTLNRLRVELERTGETLDARSYSDLRARIELQERRVEIATRKAREKQAALDDARSAEAVKQQREVAQRMLDQRENELRHNLADLASKRETVLQLMRDIPFLEQRHSILLRETDLARQAVQQTEGVTTNV